MKPVQIIVILTTFALMGGAVFMAMNKPAFEGVKATSENLQDTPRHPVTDEMRARAEAKEGELAPEIDLPSTTDKNIQLSSLIEQKPVVVVMTKDGCPCSIEVQPHYTEIAKAYAGEVTFLGVIDGNLQTAENFKHDFEVPYEFVYTEELDTFKLFDAKQSVYTYLIAKGGNIIKIWPGYSKGSLKQLNTMIAKELGQEPADLPFEMAPEEMTSGCFFFMPIGTDEPAW
ncbi:MAG: redoxin domain-containing protein [Armatimonadetes bacterium]|nr:redoxin domain-containing protein [Armatimonadota bacterium]